MENLEVLSNTEQFLINGGGKGKLLKKLAELVALDYVIDEFMAGWNSVKC